MQAGKQLAEHRKRQQPGDGNEGGNGGGQKGAAVVQQHPPCVERTGQMDGDCRPQNGGNGIIHQGSAKAHQCKYPKEQVFVGNQHHGYCAGGQHQHGIGKQAGKPRDYHTGPQRNQAAHNAADGKRGAIFLGRKDEKCLVVIRLLHDAPSGQKAPCGVAVGTAVVFCSIAHPAAAVNKGDVGILRLQPAFSCKTGRKYSDGGQM